MQVFDQVKVDDEIIYIFLSKSTLFSNRNNAIFMKIEKKLVSKLFIKLEAI